MSEEEEKKEKEEAKQKAETADKERAAAAEKARAESEAKAIEDAKITSPLEEARILDKSIKDGNAEKEKLLDREEKMRADDLIAGKGFAPKPKEFTDEEIASRKRIKAVADASGASWGKKYE